jgi:Flp pilus assembly protein TadG
MGMYSDLQNRALGKPSKPTFRSFLRARSGAAAVEFALLAIPFFFVVFAIIETAIVMAAGIMLDNAVNDVARRVMTGEVQASNLDAADFRSLVCGGVTTLMSCNKVKIDLRTYPAANAIPRSVTLKLGTVDDSKFCFDPGSQDTITVLRAFYEWPYVASMLSNLVKDTNGNAVLFSMAAFMNEPFGSTASSKSTCS